MIYKGFRDFTKVHVPTVLSIISWLSLV